MASLKCSLFMFTFFASFYIYPLCFSFLCYIFFSLAHQVVFFFYSLCNIKAFCCNLFIRCKAGFPSFLFLHCFTHPSRCPFLCFIFLHFSALTHQAVLFSLLILFAFFSYNPQVNWYFDDFLALHEKHICRRKSRFYLKLKVDWTTNGLKQWNKNSSPKPLLKISIN